MSNDDPKHTTIDNPIIFNIWYGKYSQGTNIGLYNSKLVNPHTVLPLLVGNGTHPSSLNSSRLKPKNSVYTRKKIPFS